MQPELWPENLTHPNSPASAGKPEALPNPLLQDAMGSLVAGRRKKRPARAPITKEYLLENVKIDPNTGCWIWKAGTNGRGYGREYDGILGKCFVVHRRTYELWIGPIPPGLYSLHKCDNPPCCNPDHLFLGTQTQNMQDCSLKGRKEHKLSNAQVLAIRNDPRPGATVARDYGIGNQHVSRIRLWQRRTNVK